jgi:UDP-N-acetylmuramoyl-tripeptide--D-alanyl-D-alanine ligase
VIPLELSEVARLCPGELVAAAGATEITGVRIDSRRVEPGDLFVAVGRGVDYVTEARGRGAAATLTPDDALAALGALAQAVRDRSDARVVAITGSTGKTSTKDILAALCRPHARTIAAEGGHNNEIGLPLTLTRIEPDTEIVVAEMGMRGLGHIAALCAIARPHIGIVTSIGPVHLELLGTVERVAQAKAEILQALPRGGVAIVPADAPALEPFIPPQLDVRRFSDRDVEAFELSDGRARFRFRDRELDFSFTARYQATNAVAALLALEALGLPLPAGPVEVALSRWRGEESPLPGGGLLINDAYNANPTSMRAALAHLVERADGRRRVAVLGEMAELGPEGPRFHDEVGHAAADAGVDSLVAVGPLARAYLDPRIRERRWVAGAEDALTALEEIVRPGDCVLVKGSRAVGLEVVADALQPVPA